MVRRAVALALLGAGIAAAVWLVSIGLGHVGKSGPKKTTPAPAPVLRIVFPEGFTRKQMAERISVVDGIAKRNRGIEPSLSAAKYLRWTGSSLLPARFAKDHKRRNLEGFLFPATYDFYKHTPTKTLVRDQLQTFGENWSKVNLRYARSKNLTPYDVLGIASMIEAEVRAPEERALVSAVIYNRLHARMPLGIDATIRYALGIPPTKSLTRSELNDPTPYNTRIHRGLPPTPIGNPGLASIQAAAHPAKVNYLYFVRKPDKMHHFFTASYDKFIAYLKAHGYPTT